jgi:pimeloyl-ACP methyl ester carboxylesterase
MAIYLLIHGGMHGGWCWERVVPLLEAAGHHVLAPDLPGMGSDTTPFAANVLDQWTDAMGALVEQSQGPVIVVGHSRAGVTLSELGERMPDRIAWLVYLAAVLPKDGKGMGDMVTDFPHSGAARLAAGVAVDAEAGTLTMTDMETAEWGFYNMCPAEDVAAAQARLSPEPLAIMTSPVRVTPERFGKVPRAYIETEFDNAVPLADQRAMQADWPCQRVVTLPSDHSPFYSMPDRLAEALLSFA